MQTTFFNNNIFIHVRLASYRLWGDHGQALLEGAQVCVINATGFGTEILKGLVLPGIGGFTIVDGGIVTEEDIGVKCVANRRPK